MNPKMGDFWTNTGLGLIAVIIYALSTYSQQQILEMIPGLVALIICTAGLSLLVIVPALYIIGTILYACWMLGSFLFSQFQSRPRAKASRGVPVTGKIVAVANYIVSARQAGLSNIEITSNLEANGWDNASITHGFDYVLFREELHPSGGLP